MSNGELFHIGTERHSGRYPWGSGKNPEQRSPSLGAYERKLRSQGLSEEEIAKGLNLKSGELRARNMIAREEELAANCAMAYRLKEKGYSNVAIGKRMGVNESVVRSYLDPSRKVKEGIVKATADILKKSADEKKYIDVGSGVEQQLGVTRVKLDAALVALKDQGYDVKPIRVKQQGTDKYTNMRILVPPGTTLRDIYANREKIDLPLGYSTDRGETFKSLDGPIQSLDSKRIKIRYGDEGGSAKDGVIELRRGVEDISLGNSKYAQVRVGVDGTHYMKGMAMYSDDIPKGFDVVYNTNKKSGTPPDQVFKSAKDDPYNPDNPFGTIVRRREYIGKDGKTHISALNIVNEEGTWEKYSKNLSSQVLSKQSPALAKKQLGLDFDIRKEEFDEIMSLTNPSVKQVLLKTFSDECDSAAVHLKAAALPRQGWHVILPISSIKENEVYAPKYDDGERVVLIRHPHGGIFEIPELIVNNKNPEAKRLIGNARDAVGIHSKVAEKLSGADFDGDDVIVIPNKNKFIQTRPSLTGLKNFNPKEAYPGFPGMKGIGNQTQLKMGEISNLITDMTIKGANDDEICRAVKHSMVVIDAEKHNLNFKQSYIDNNISDLRRKYQGGPTSGASTLISRAKSETHIPGVREDRIIIDPITGKKSYTYKQETYTNKKGKVIARTTKSTRMADTEDAFTLSSGTKMENVYASYANSLKDLANKARKEMISIKDIKYSPAARETYKKEVEALDASLSIALRNRPLERKAHLVAGKIVGAKRAANPGMDKKELKKIKGQELERARYRFDSKKRPIEITDRQWEAIQAGAVTKNKLHSILLNTDLDKLKERAMPRTFKSMSPAKISRAKAMLENGYTRADIARALGVSTSTLGRSLD